MDRTFKNSLILTIGLTGLVATACEPAAEYRAALPKADDVTVDVPAQGSSTRGLVGTTKSALVGEKSDWYSQTYHHAKDINTLGALVVNLVESIAALPASKVGEDFAVWGPHSDDNDPNEWMMTVQRIDDARYDWRIEGKHKADSDFVTLANGTFEPTGDDLGRGWFQLDFNAIAELDPTEDARGFIAYAFDKDKSGINVRVRFKGPDERGDNVVAGYAFGEKTSGEGFFIFAFPTSIDEDENPQSADEDVLIRTRWIKGGAGRSDVVAQNGDLDRSIAQASQCWNDRFVSTYEVLKIDGNIKAEDGEARSCVLPEAMLPTDADLPEDTDVENPFNR